MIPATQARETTESAARFSKSITPHDTNEVADYIPKGIWVGGAGNLVVQLYGDTADVTFTNVPAGTLLPLAVRLVKVTGTTATGLVVVW
jgi:hypothetical protein